MNQSYSENDYSSQPQSTYLIHPEKRYNSELLLYHFGFNPKEFLDIWFDGVHLAAASTVEKLGKKISYFPSHVRENILFSFETLLVSHLDKIWGAVETYFKEAVWNIPPHIYIPSSHVMKPPEGVTEAKLQELQGTFRQTQLRFLQINYARLKMRERAPELENTIHDLRENLNNFEENLASLQVNESLNNLSSSYQELLDLDQILHSHKKGHSKMSLSSPPQHWQWVSAELGRLLLREDSVETEIKDRQLKSHAARALWKPEDQMVE